jgi:hypothetical protein
LAGHGAPTQQRQAAARSALWGRHPAAERHSARLERHSARLERRSAPDRCCRAVRAAGAAAYPRPRGAAQPQRVRLSALAVRPARRLVESGVSAERVRQRPAPVASAEQARQRAQPEVSAEQVLQREARMASAQQAAALPPGGRAAAEVRRPAADAVGAALDVEAAPQLEVRRALVAQVRGAAAVRAWAAEQPSAAPGAPAAWACHPDRLRSAPAPPPAGRFARATTGLRIASP